MRDACRVETAVIAVELAMGAKRFVLQGVLWIESLPHPAMEYDGLYETVSFR